MNGKAAGTSDVETPGGERLEATLERLKRERDEADRRYNEALTALDRSIGAPLALPDPPPSFDAHQAAALNDAWNVVPAPPGASGVRGRMAGFVWRIIAPYLQRQLTFNSWLVDHLNRNLSAAQDAHRAALGGAAALRAHAASMAEFQSRLVQYLQQITLYVDTRDRDAAGKALVLNAAISGVAENADKRVEAMAARERRMHAEVSALEAEHADLRKSLGVVHQAAMTVKREVERLAAAGSAGSPRPEAGAVPRAEGAFAPALDAYKYLAFEDQFRGSREEIRTRLESYVPFFAGASDVLDVGCGRGEFLELLSAAGIGARGLDLNHEMVEACRARGLDAVEGDAVGYLETLPDASLGGVFAAQVVEHLQPGYLLSFLDLAFQKLRPGGRLVLETLNPSCWIAFFDSYLRDITHVWPLHPDTLQFLVLASGFSRADVEYRSPVRPEDRLQSVRLPAEAGAALVEIVEAFNANVEKLNARMFTSLDYAVIGVR